MVFVFNDYEQPLALQGEWKFRRGDDSSWCALDFHDGDWAAQTVPGFWPNGNTGVAWYRAWLELPSDADGSRTWALALRQVFVAAEVYWDGRLLVRHGKIGVNRQSEQPGVDDHQYVILPQFVKPGRHLIAMRLSNHHWLSGGFGQAPAFGDYRILFGRQEKSKTWYGFLAGLFFLFGISHLMLFFYERSQRGYLLLALLSFVVTLLAVLLELPDLFDLNRSLFEVRSRGIWVLMMTAVLLMYWFLTAQFEYRNPWLTKLMIAGSALLAAFMLLPLDFPAFNRFLPARDLWFQFTLFVGMYVIFWSIRKNKPGSRILALGVLPLVLGGVYSSLKFESVWGLAGFATFTLAMAASLSRKVAGIAREVRRGRDVFRRFVPEQLLDKIAKEGLEGIKLGSVEEGKATVLFTDIRSFASIAENLSPGDTLVFLNAFMQRMQPVIHDHGGFICQFVGDEIMAIFYFPEQGAAAVRAAIDMRKTLETHNHERLARGEQPIDAGIGVNTGRVILGTIGSEVRMESCVIGDTVNLASRIQSLTRFYGVKVLVSESTYRELQSPGQFHVREIDLVQVKGKTRPVAIYEIFDADPEELKVQKRAARAPHTRGLRYFREREWEKARAEFEACLALSPEDSIARLYFERCEEYFNHPPGPGWNGVTVLHDK